jgi:hypothetical protein
MRLAWEEPFGPVIPVIRVKSVEEAVDHCNTNNLALQGCVFTTNVDRAIAISDAMETGTVQARMHAGALCMQAPSSEQTPMHACRPCPAAAMRAWSSLDARLNAGGCGRSPCACLKEDCFCHQGLISNLKRSCAACCGTCVLL